MDEERDGIRAELRAINGRLERIEAWTERHAELHDRDVQRLARLESAVGTRTLLGGLGIVGSFIANLFGLKQP